MTQFEIFCEEFKRAKNLLGLRHVRFSLHEGMDVDAPNTEEMKIAGYSAYYPEEQICDIWYDSKTGEEPRYVAWHEACEVLLAQIRYFAIDCVHKRKWNENGWDELAHEAINRICSSQGFEPLIEKDSKRK